jgi:hypothetical protein
MLIDGWVEGWVDGWMDPYWPHWKRLVLFVRTTFTLEVPFPDPFGF